ncbi:MAG TPA: hypothetical protein VGG64_17330 [Pirellulales bacterium]|jgi:hypothetical protein
MRGYQIKGEFVQNSNAMLCARAADMPMSPYAEGTPYVTADVQSIQCTVTVGDVQTWSSSLTPSSVWFDALQGWAADSIGYNFRHSLPGSALSTAPAVAKVVYVVTLTDGYVFTIEFVGPVREVP